MSTRNLSRREEILNASVAYNEKFGKWAVIGGDGMLSEEGYLELNKNSSFIAGAEWADRTAWKPADGDNLPEIDREVIALVEENGYYKVVFAHRPNPNGDAVCYDEGGWNLPNVKWWLDSNIEKLINNEEDNKR